MNAPNQQVNRVVGDIQRPSNMKPKKSKRRISRKAIVVGIAILITIALLGLIGWQIYRSSTLLNTSRYQSITLTNGRQYFGKLESLNGQYLKMTDVYYLVEQQAQASTNESGQSASAQQTPSLIKYGTEIFAPEDELLLPRDQITSISNLKDSGKVIDAIKSYKSQQNN